MGGGSGGGGSCAGGGVGDGCVNHDSADGSDNGGGSAGEGVSDMGETPWRTRELPGQRIGLSFTIEPPC